MPSLAQQLRVLAGRGENATPVGMLRKRASLLFSERDAAGMDARTVRELAEQGVRALARRDARVAALADGLVAPTTVSFERGLLSHDRVEEVNAELKDALLLLSPFILEQPAQHVLEYLVRQYDVHCVLVEEFLLTAMPYHDTPLFVRCIQIADLKSTVRWRFLEANATAGVPLSRSALATQCQNDTGLLSVLYQRARLLAQRAVDFQAAAALFGAVAADALRPGPRGAVHRPVLSALLPCVLEGLAEKVSSDCFLACSAVAAHLARAVPLNESAVLSLVKAAAAVPPSKDEPPTESALHENSDSDDDVTEGLQGHNKEERPALSPDLYAPVLECLCAVLNAQPSAAAQEPVRRAAAAAVRGAIPSPKELGTAVARALRRGNLDALAAAVPSVATAVSEELETGDTPHGSGAQAIASALTSASARERAVAVRQIATTPESPAWQDKSVVKALAHLVQTESSEPVLEALAGLQECAMPRRAARAIGHAAARRLPLPPSLLTGARVENGALHSCNAFTVTVIHLAEDSAEVCARLAALSLPSSELPRAVQRAALARARRLCLERLGASSSLEEKDGSSNTASEWMQNGFALPIASALVGSSEPHDAVSRFLDFLSIGVDRSSCDPPSYIARVFTAMACLSCAAARCSTPGTQSATATDASAKSKRGRRGAGRAEATPHSSALVSISNALWLAVCQSWEIAAPACVRLEGPSSMPSAARAIRRCEGARALAHAAVAGVCSAAEALHAALDSAHEQGASAVSVGELDDCVCSGLSQLLGLPGSLNSALAVAIAALVHAPCRSTAELGDEFHVSARVAGESAERSSWRAAAAALTLAAASAPQISQVSPEAAASLLACALDSSEVVRSSALAAVAAVPSTAHFARVVRELVQGAGSSGSEAGVQTALPADEGARASVLARALRASRKDKASHDVLTIIAQPAFASAAAQRCVGIALGAADALALLPKTAAPSMLASAISAGLVDASAPALCNALTATETSEAALSRLALHAPIEMLEHTAVVDCVIACAARGDDAEKVAAISARAAQAGAPAVSLAQAAARFFEQGLETARGVDSQAIRVATAVRPLMRVGEESAVLPLLQTVISACRRMLRGDGGEAQDRTFFVEVLLLLAVDAAHAVRDSDAAAAVLQEAASAVESDVAVSAAARAIAAYAHLAECFPEKLVFPVLICSHAAQRHTNVQNACTAAACAAAKSLCSALAKKDATGEPLAQHSTPRQQSSRRRGATSSTSESDVPLALVRLGGAILHAAAGAPPSHKADLLQPVPSVAGSVDVVAAAPVAVPVLCDAAARCGRALGHWLVVGAIDIVDSPSQATEFVAALEKGALAAHISSARLLDAATAVVRERAPWRASKSATVACKGDLDARNHDSRDTAIAALLATVAHSALNAMRQSSNGAEDRARNVGDARHALCSAFALRQALARRWASPGAASDRTARCCATAAAVVGADDLPDAVRSAIQRADSRRGALAYLSVAHTDASARRREALAELVDDIAALVTVDQTCDISVADRLAALEALGSLAAASPRRAATAALRASASVAESAVVVSTDTDEVDNSAGSGSESSSAADASADEVTTPLGIACAAAGACGAIVSQCPLEMCLAAIPAASAAVASCCEGALSQLAREPRNRDASDAAVVALSTAEALVRNAGSLVSPQLVAFLRASGAAGRGAGPQESQTRHRSRVAATARRLGAALGMHVPPRLLVDAAETVWQQAAAGADGAGTRVAALDAYRTSAERFGVTDIAARHRAMFRFSARAVAAAPRPSAERAAALAALESLVLRLSEKQLRPLLARLARRAAEALEAKAEDATVTALACLDINSSLATALRGLFAPHFASLVDAAVAALRAGAERPAKRQRRGRNSSAPAQVFVLRSAAVQSLSTALRFDDSDDVDGAVTPELFERLTEPLVDALDMSSIGGPSFRTFARDELAPCVGRLAAAGGSDVQWKMLNRSLMLKTQSGDALTRLGAVQCAHKVLERLGADYNALLPETIPYIAERMEDENAEVEESAHAFVRTIEDVTGEKLDAYL